MFNKTQLLLFFILLGTTLITISCKKIVQSEFPDIEQTPVVNSIIKQDSVIKINISLSGKLDSNDLTFIKNAVVKLYVDDVLAETINHSSDGMYISNIIAESGKKYSCVIEIQGYDELKCSCTIPKKTEILETSHENLAYIDEEGTIFPSITLKFKNNPDTLLYYEAIIKVLKYESYFDENDSLYEESAYFNAPLVGIEDPIIINEGLPIAVFSNKIIPGNEYTMTLNYSTRGTSWNLSHLYPIIVELRSVSYDYYKYAQALYLYEEQLDNESIDGRIIPLSIYSNVEGGFGIFTGYSTYATDTIFPE
ncbi:MAG: DUF4249 domain-containing protein [Clostridia bacterium]|nr:DUF4249 domain-containing protein [Clostridia bacterium]